MTSLWRTIRSAPDDGFASPGQPGFSLDQLAAQLGQIGGSQPLDGIQQTLVGDRETIEGSFRGYAEGAYKSNGIVFACMAVRMLLFSEARFQFRRLAGGRPGDLFGTTDLAPLEKPTANTTTGDLLTRAILDADLAGNWYLAKRPGGALRRLQPDRVTIITGSKTGREIDAELVGYSYEDGGPGGDPIVLLPDEVAHWAPIPDPLARFRGMSWLTPIVREVQADSAATTHKLKFFENGATVNMVVTFDKDVTKEAFERWADVFEKGHRGHLNAYKTLYVGGGAVATPVGANMQQLDFKVVQGAGETRIAAAAGVPPVIVGLSEGLQAATYSNYGQARRRLTDGTMRPLWRSIAGAVAPLVNVPAAAELWYDDRDIPFLQEDLKDAAETQQVDAITVKTLIDAGYDANTVTAAVAAQDFTLLKHTGLVSVQLQKPGETPPGAPGAPAT